MKRTNHPRAEPVEIEYDAKKYSASYVVERGGLTVTTQWGSKYAVLHASRPEGLAKIMLREILDEAKARGHLG